MRLFVLQKICLKRYAVSFAIPVTPLRLLRGNAVMHSCRYEVQLIAVTKAVSPIKDVYVHVCLRG